jgi:hypothetical protein
MLARDAATKSRKICAVPALLFLIFRWAPQRFVVEHIGTTGSLARDQAEVKLPVYRCLIFSSAHTQS